MKSEGTSTLYPCEAGGEQKAAPMLSDTLHKLPDFGMPAQVYSEGSCTATQDTALRVQLNQLYSPSKPQPNPQIPETGQYTYIYNSTTGLQGEMDVDMSAIGHAFARGVDEGKVQASN